MSTRAEIFKAFSTPPAPRTKPTDTEIIAVIREGRGAVMPTYYIKNCLRRLYVDLQTSWVLRRLKALEKAGQVRRATTSYATMICRELGGRAAAVVGTADQEGA